MDFCKREAEAGYVNRTPTSAGINTFFVAIDAETKLLPSFAFGKGTAAFYFFALWMACKNAFAEIQLTSNTFVPYIQAVEDRLRCDGPLGNRNNSEQHILLADGDGWDRILSLNLDGSRPEEFIHARHTAKERVFIDKPG